MQETRNNCLGSKKCSTTLHQALTDKHECQNVTATYKTKYNQIRWQHLNLKQILLKISGFENLIKFKLGKNGKINKIKLK